jgi:hypothetical protein
MHDSLSQSEWKEKILQSYSDHADDTADWRSGPHDGNILHTLEASDTVYSFMNSCLSPSAKEEFCSSRLSKISFDFDDNEKVKTFPPLQHGKLFVKGKSPSYKQLMKMFNLDSADKYGLTFYLKRDKLCSKMI